jgi:hypothetical protein
MTAALFRPLTHNSRMQRQWGDGRTTARVVGQFIKPNDRLSSFERLEIYNRQYWFRILDSFYDDYPALRAVLGERAFLQLAEAYLTKNPSRSFSMRNLGSRLVYFLRHQPGYARNNLRLAVDVARFEWAQILAFDEAARPPAGLAELVLSSPESVRLRLQPHLQLLALSYPIDDFVAAVKRSDAPHATASNAMTSAPTVVKSKKISLPERRRTYVAIHRYRNSVYHKRLEPEAYRLLSALGKAATLEQACESALRRAPKGVDWQAKVSQWFENWSTLGWFWISPLDTGNDARAAISPTE